jgi:hypothetical protein
VLARFVLLFSSPPVSSASHCAKHILLSLGSGGGWRGSRLAAAQGGEEGVEGEAEHDVGGEEATEEATRRGPWIGQLSVDPWAAATALVQSPCAAATR